jgi:hypothetical protein
MNDEGTAIGDVVRNFITLKSTAYDYIKYPN